MRGALWRPEAAPGNPNNSSHSFSPDPLLIPTLSLWEHSRHRGRPRGSQGSAVGTRSLGRLVWSTCCDLGLSSQRRLTRSPGMDAFKEGGRAGRGVNVPLLCAQRCQDQPAL